VQYRVSGFKYDGLRFASDAIRDKIVEVWQKNNEGELRAFVKSASNDPSASGFAGHLFEALAHQEFERLNGKPVLLSGRVLGTDAKCNRSVLVKAAADRSPFNKSGATSVAANSDVDCYYRPCVGNLPAFDAFIIQKNELLLFQFTVAKAHSVQGHFLTQFVNAVLNKHPSIKVVSLAFVSEKAPKLAGIQKYKGTSKEPLADKNQNIEKKFIRAVTLQQLEL